MTPVGIAAALSAAVALAGHRAPAEDPAPAWVRAPAEDRAPAAGLQQEGGGRSSGRSFPLSARLHGALVVLDPGHGGSLSGAKSGAGVEEKTAALAIALVVKEKLERAGVRVRLTRGDDRHVPLSARAALANQLAADAFVSIHLNHAPDPERRGFETYVRSAEVPDARIRRLLAREEDEEEASAPVAPVKGTLDQILGDLARGVSHERSAGLARAIQDAAGRVPGLLPSRGLRQAPFTVLTDATVPAVLVEVGYLSNETQASFLGSPGGQRAAGRAIADGLLAFLRASVPGR